MSSLLDRPGLGERYGIAVNSSSLEPREGDSPIDTIGAAGFARIELEGQARNEAERIEARMAPLLWRAKYGRDAVATRDAADLLFAWLQLYPFVVEVDLVRPGQARIFSSRVLHEWLTSRCTWCGGTGWQERTRTGKRIRPTGQSRNAKLIICSACRGSGRLRTSPIERCKALSSPGAWRVDRGEYVRLWARLFSLTLARVQWISKAPRGPLQSALAGDTVRV
jgi:hypothetical protein